MWSSESERESVCDCVRGDRSRERELSQQLAVTVIVQCMLQLLKIEAEFPFLACYLLIKWRGLTPKLAVTSALEQ